KLDKPKITAMSGYSNQVVATKTFTLTCVVLGADLFEWYNGGTKLSTTTATYTDTASASTVGAFT
ncbi:GPI-anchored protein PB15E9.01c, partial [Biomphalaria glabrata]